MDSNVAMFSKHIYFLAESNALRMAFMGTFVSAVTEEINASVSNPILALMFKHKSHWWIQSEAHSKPPELEEIPEQAKLVTQTAINASQTKRN